jgi:hypothetical protein
MPFGDGTGPLGLGPMTGRGAGYCAGYPVPGFMNPYVPGFGRGFFRRRAFYGYPYFGFGRGRGFGRGFFWRRFALYGYPYTASLYPTYSASNLNPEEEKKLLLEETKILQEQLAEIKKRLNELEGKAGER